MGEKIACSLFLLTLFSPQTPIFLFTISVQTSTVHNSVYTPFPLLLLKLSYSITDILFVSHKFWSVFLHHTYSDIPIVISSIFQNIPHDHLFQFLFNSRHLVFPLLALLSQQSFAALVKFVWPCLSACVLCAETSCILNNEQWSEHRWIRYRTLSDGFPKPWRLQEPFVMINESSSHL